METNVSHKFFVIPTVLLARFLCMDRVYW